MTWPRYWANHYEERAEAGLHPVSITSQLSSRLIQTLSER